ncbi:hypothetical protein HDU92_002643 [Lobulomyces angularis]|nr:hypothetical protein HDU92_002643 [Lobulomyces angularis]
MTIYNNIYLTSNQIQLSKTLLTDTSPLLIEFTTSYIQLLWNNISLNQSVFNPNKEFQLFVKDILNKTNLCFSVLLISLKFISKLKKFNPGQVGQGSECRIFICSLMLSMKFLMDNSYTNETWEKVSNIPISQINKAEVEFLVQIRFDLNISEKEYAYWLIDIEQKVKEYILIFENQKILKEDLKLKELFFYQQQQKHQQEKQKQLSQRNVQSQLFNHHPSLPLQKQQLLYSPGTSLNSSPANNQLHQQILQFNRNNSLQYNQVPNNIAVKSDSPLSSCSINSSNSPSTATPKSFSHSNYTKIPRSASHFNDLSNSAIQNDNNDSNLNSFNSLNVSSNNHDMFMCNNISNPSPNLALNNMPQQLLQQKAVVTQQSQQDLSGNLSKNYLLEHQKSQQLNQIRQQKHQMIPSDATQISHPLTPTSTLSVDQQNYIPQIKQHQAPQSINSQLLLQRRQPQFQEPSQLQHSNHPFLQQAPTSRPISLDGSLHHHNRQKFVPLQQASWENIPDQNRSRDSLPQSGRYFTPSQQHNHSAAFQQQPISQLPQHSRFVQPLLENNFVNINWNKPSMAEFLEKPSRITPVIEFNYYNPFPNFGSK